MVHCRGNIFFLMTRTHKNRHNCSLSFYSNKQENWSRKQLVFWSTKNRFFLQLLPKSLFPLCYQPKQETIAAVTFPQLRSFLVRFIVSSQANTESNKIENFAEITRNSSVLLRSRLENWTAISAKVLCLKFDCELGRRVRFCRKSRNESIPKREKKNGDNK